MLSSAIDTTNGDYAFFTGRISNGLVPRKVANAGYNNNVCVEGGMYRLTQS